MSEFSELMWEEILPLEWHLCQQRRSNNTCDSNSSSWSKCVTGDLCPFLSQPGAMIQKRLTSGSLKEHANFSWLTQTPSAVREFTADRESRECRGLWGWCSGLHCCFTASRSGVEILAVAVPFCVEFACSHWVCVGSSRLLEFPPPSEH